MAMLLSGEIDLNGYASHSITTKTAAIGDHTTRALVGAAVPIIGRPLAMMTLRGVIIVNKSTATTVVPTGGLVEIENDGLDWKPFETYLNMSSFVGANAGAPQSPTVIPCKKPLPAGSNVSIYYTAINAATDSLEVTLIYTTEPWVPGSPQTFFKSGKGTAITQVTVAAAHVTVAIPSTKGGKGIGFLAQVYGTLETIVVSGGLVQVTNGSCSPSIEPMDFYTGGLTAVGTGGGELPLLKLDHNFDAPANSTFSFAYQPIDNQSQYLAVSVVWEG